jgi:hypothetical protein
MTVLTSLTYKPTQHYLGARKTVQIIAEMPSDQRAELEDAVWQRVLTGALDICWPDIKPDKKTGRNGCFKFSIKQDGTTYGCALRMSRMVWLLTKVKTDDDLHALLSALVVGHDCNNGMCCNPAHMQLYSQKRNLEYMSECGRSFYQLHPEQHRGELNPHSKITTTEVLAIRRACPGHSTATERKALAEKFNLSESMIGRIIYRQSWKSRSYSQYVRLISREARSWRKSYWQSSRLWACLGMGKRPDA